MPERLDWRQNDPGEVLTRAAQHLAAGGLVALPTESGYEVVASALNPAAVDRLQALTDDTPLALVLSATAEALDWLPYLRGPGARMVRKLGPGPWRLQAEGGVRFGLLPRLPAAVQEQLSTDQYLALRWPQHPAWAGLARALGQPLVTAPVVPDAAAGAQAVDALGDRVALVVDDEPYAIGKPATLVRVDGPRWQVVREGDLTADELAEVLACRILFVCTGNTCRSPMAEALCATLLAEQLGCAPDELNQRGFRVQSAGLAAMMGEGAAAAAVEIIRRRGGDLSRHRSQPITYELYTLADHVFVMTDSHLQALRGVRVPTGPVPRLLAPGGEDVADPIGHEQAVYETCAGQILAALRQRLPELQEA